MEGSQFRLNTFLLSRHLINIAITKLKQRLALSIIRLINLTTIRVERKEIVHRHRSCVIQAARHDSLTIQERFQIAVLNPEERVLSSLPAKVVIAQHHRTKR